ncbi:MAG: hypothetical protein ACE5K3_09520 [bacterium]
MKREMRGLLVMIGLLLLAGVETTTYGEEESKSIGSREFTLWRETKEGAFYGFIPKGWVAQGEVARPFEDATLQFEARGNDQGTKVFFFFAPLPSACVEPNSVLSMYGNTEGTWWEIPYTSYRYYVLRYLPGGEYVKNCLLPNLKHQFPDAQIERIVDRPDLRQIYGVYGATERYDAADAVITYTTGNTRMKAGYTVITKRLYVNMGMGVDFGLWGVYMMGCHSPEDEFEKVQSLYTTFIPTFRVNSEWMRREMAAQQQRGRIISGTWKRIIEMDYKMWVEESESRMRVARGWMNALGGTEDYINRTTGEKFTLPVIPEADFYWQRGTEIVGTKLDQMPHIGYTRLEEIAR